MLEHLGRARCRVVNSWGGHLGVFRGEVVFFFSFLSFFLWGLARVFMGAGVAVQEILEEEGMPLGDFFCFD